MILLSPSPWLLTWCTPHASSQCTVTNNASRVTGWILRIHWLRDELDVVEERHIEVGGSERMTELRREEDV
jgi:hypothetical protein